MVTNNGDGSFTVTRGDSGTPVIFKLQQDPNGSDRLQVVSTGNTGSPSPFMELETTVDGRAAGKLIDVGGSTDVVTDPNGYIAWAG